MAPLAPRVGDPDIILDDPRFVIAGAHARGSASIIYRATDTWLGRQVAIKAPAGREPGAWHRLTQEASILSRLDHPWILSVYHSGTTVSGAPYLATRLVEGETLEQRLKRDPSGWKLLLRHVVDVAEAMAYAHGRGVIHRDLKPANVLIDAQGHTVVIDWGVAREIASADADLHETSGSPGYRAPEARDGPVTDPRADVYSIGAILYRMIAGRPAHPDVPVGAELERDLAGASPELRALVARATAPSPAARPATAALLADELRALLPRPSRLERSLVPRSRSGKIAGAVAVVGVGAALVAGGVALMGRDERPRLAAEAIQETVVWTGNFGPLIVRLDEAGKLRGVYHHDGGYIEGTLRGHVLHLRWCEAPWVGGKDQGTATLAFSADDSAVPTFAGSYSYAESPSESGPWVLHAAPAAAVTDDLRARLAAWTWPCPAR